MKHVQCTQPACARDVRHLCATSDTALRVMSWKSLSDNKLVFNFINGGLTGAIFIIYFFKLVYYITVQLAKNWDFYRQYTFMSWKYRITAGKLLYKLYEIRD